MLGFASKFSAFTPILKRGKLQATSSKQKGIHVVAASKIKEDAVQGKYIAMTLMS